MMSSAWAGGKQNHFQQFIVLKPIGAGFDKAMAEPVAMAGIIPRLLFNLFSHRAASYSL